MNYELSSYEYLRTLALTISSLYIEKEPHKKKIKQFFSIISVLPAWNKFSIALQKNLMKKQIRDMTESKSML